MAQERCDGDTTGTLRFGLWDLWGTAEELASPLHPPLDAPIVIRTHVLEAHEVSVEALEDSSQIGATYTCRSDGRN